MVWTEILNGIIGILDFWEGLCRRRAQVEYYVSDKREGSNSDSYGILSIDVQVKRLRDEKLVIVSHSNLYRIKK